MRERAHRKIGGLNFLWRDPKRSNLGQQTQYFA